MRGFRISILILLVLCTIIICSCSNRKPVTVIQNEQQPPTTAKAVNTDKGNAGHNYSEDIKAELKETGFTITDPQTTHTVKYDNVEELMYMTELDYSSDTLTDGTDSEYEVYATMTTESGDEYYLAIYKTTPVYISVTAAGQTYIFNIDGVKNTKEFYDSLKSKLGYNG